MSDKKVNPIFDESIKSLLKKIPMWLNELWLSQDSKDKRLARREMTSLIKDLSKVYWDKVDPELFTATKLFRDLDPELQAKFRKTYNIE